MLFGVTSTHSSSRMNSKRLLEGKRTRRNEPDELVRGGGAHVRQLLLLGGVDVEIFATGVLANDHALAVAEALRPWDGKDAPMSAHVVTATK